MNFPIQIFSFTEERCYKDYKSFHKPRVPNQNFNIKSLCAHIFITLFSVALLSNNLFLGTSGYVNMERKSLDYNLFFNYLLEQLLMTFCFLFTTIHNITNLRVISKIPVNTSYWSWGDLFRDTNRNHLSVLLLDGTRINIQSLNRNFHFVIQI